ncbi:MAG TPA: RsmE family RNA methyltransferase [Gemmataceae bacterium]|nr:RsmE family RNA methyltransferase [Gemmataceae bacterium]
MADRFYVNCPLAPGPVEVAGPEAHHLAVVCRVRRGDVVCLFNGDGREYPAEVREVGKRTVLVDVQSVEAPQRESPHRLHVAAPLPKGDRGQFLIEKLTELGAAVFTPLQTARSVVHPRETKLDKLQRYVVEASKQCGRNVLMTIEPLTPWAEFLRRTDLPHCKVLAHPGGAAWAASAGEAVAAVGPEGGFTDEEVDAVRSAGWAVVGLGPRILRVETAAMVLAACAAFR